MNQNKDLPENQNSGVDSVKSKNTHEKPKTVIPSETWVELYATLSSYILEYSSLDPIWIVDEDGTEVRTEEKQDEFIDIANEVENILSEIDERDSRWLYGKRQPRHSRKGYTNQGRTLPGIGFKNNW